MTAGEQDRIPVAPLRASVPKTRLFLESRYRKLKRGLPQTIFFCPSCKGHRRRRKNCPKCEGRGKLYPDSVQELIARGALPAYRAQKGKFHGAGREDLDVLMLGSGRPFVFEVVKPRMLNVDLEALRERILERAQGAIEIEPFRLVARERVVYWKESHFDKIYRAVVRTAAPPARLQEIVGRKIDIAQRTPARVAHRRADLTRERTVTVQAIEAREENQLEITVRCAHGTYVKEWISGEEGRTQPALPDLLGVACACEQLDVLEILT